MHSYTDEVQANDKRFDKINHFPQIFSKSKHVPLVHFDKVTTREDLDKYVNNIPNYYNPNKDAVLDSKGKSAPKLRRMIGRTLKDSIYPQFVAPTNATTESIERGIKMTQKGSNPKGNVAFARMSERDDKMYKVTERYQPKKELMDPYMLLALQKLKKKEEISKKMSERSEEEINIIKE